LESASKNVLGINLDGSYAELKKEPEFQFDLLMVASEIDVSKYINPKTSLLAQLGLKYWNKFKEFKEKQQAWVLPDEKHVDEIIKKHEEKNLEKLRKNLEK